MYDLLISFVGQPFDLELLKYSQYCYLDIASVERAQQMHCNGGSVGEVLDIASVERAQQMVVCGV